MSMCRKQWVVQELGKTFGNSENNRTINFVPFRSKRVDRLKRRLSIFGQVVFVSFEIVNDGYDTG